MSITLTNNVSLILTADSVNPASNVTQTMSSTVIVCIVIKYMYVKKRVTKTFSYALDFWGGLPFTKWTVHIWRPHNCGILWHPPNPSCLRSDTDLKYKIHATSLTASAFWVTPSTPPTADVICGWYESKAPGRATLAHISRAQSSGPLLRAHVDLLLLVRKTVGGGASSNLIKRNVVSSALSTN